MNISSLRRPALGALATVALGLTLVAPTFATNSVTATVTGGTIAASITNAAMSTLITSHTAQNASGTLVLAADDSSGTALGWHVTVQSSALAYTSGGFGGTSIPAANLSLTTPSTPVVVVGQPVNATNGPKVVGGGGPLSAPITVIVAVGGYGMGTYTQSLPALLVIPADARAGTYTATLTVTILAEE